MWDRAWCQRWEVVVDCAGLWCHFTPPPHPDLFHELVDRDQGVWQPNIQDHSEGVLRLALQPQTPIGPGLHLLLLPRLVEWRYGVRAGLRILDERSPGLPQIRRVPLRRDAVARALRSRSATCNGPKERRGLFAVPPVLGAVHERAAAAGVAAGGNLHRGRGGHRRKTLARMVHERSRRWNRVLPEKSIASILPCAVPPRCVRQYPCA
mmetsp:Transcript_7232/g.13269  ORF Transcript_7232/g.13269 Transcript_7232/m.13269 type:complete len:208 (-) Transcript_7232:1981-2604(-)